MTDVQHIAGFGWRKYETHVLLLLGYNNISVNILEIKYGSATWCR